MYTIKVFLGFPGGSDGKESAYNAGDVGSIPWRRKWIHSSILAWRIPWTEDPDRLQSMGSWRVRHNFHFFKGVSTLLGYPGVPTAVNSPTLKAVSKLFESKSSHTPGTCRVSHQGTFVHLHSCRGGLHCEIWRPFHLTPVMVMSSLSSPAVRLPLLHGGTARGRVAASETGCALTAYSICIYWGSTVYLMAFPCGSAGKESACNAGDLGSIPALWRSPGEGKGYPLQYSGLENSLAWVTKSQAQLRDFNFHCV